MDLGLERELYIGELTCVAGSGKGVSDTPVTLHIANAELAPTHPICLDLVFEKRERVTEAKEIERDGVRDGRVVSEKTWEGARFRRTPFDSVVVFTTTTMSWWS
ncbi:hypothetical protein YC2023_042675 [Brassica napus]